MVDKDNLMSCINLSMIEDNYCRKEICFVIESLIEYGRKLECEETIIDGLKAELYNIVESSHFKVVDMDFGIDIYDGKIAIYRHLYNILNSNTIENLSSELRKLGMSDQPIDEQACTDSDITSAIDMIGYSHFLSCECIEDIRVSIGSIYAHSTERLACDLYSDCLGTQYCITLFAHESEYDYIESIVRGFAKLFVALVKQFGYSKEITKLNSKRQSSTEFIENSFIHYIFSINEKLEGRDDTEYKDTYPILKDIIARM